MELLEWHVDLLPAGAMKESELLFPSETGEFRACSCLDKPFDEVVTALKLKKKITPRAMRRTFQDLARAAEVKDVVTRAVSGHATEAMQRHYSTVSAVEMRTSLAKVIDLAGIRQALAA
jgi:integrase